MILVDTSVWIDFLAREPGPSGAELRRLIERGVPVFIAGVIAAEILQGLRREVDPILNLLSRWPLLEPAGLSTYAAAAAISREARRRGLAISTVDAIIAALAIEHAAALFTADRDFQRLGFTSLRLHCSDS